MSAPAWTPGPWFVSPYKHSFGVTTKPDGHHAHRVAECMYWLRPESGQPDRAAAEANARLIGAATKLYEALERLCRVSGQTRNISDARQQARDALAEARGEPS